MERPLPIRPGRPEIPRVPALLAVTLVACSVACRSAEDWHDQADERVYRILEERRAELALDQEEFRIDPPEDSLRQRLLRGEEEARESVRAMGLLECLEVAAENSREYQTRKEALYLTALDLTFEQYLFRDRWVGGPFGDLAGDGSAVESRAAGFTTGFTKVLGTGAEIISDIGITLLRDLSTGNTWDAVTNVGLAVSQPLLRGAPRGVVREPLTQAERTVVYEVRSFERFRRTFGFSVADRMYRILQQMDTLRNAENNYANLLSLRERNEAWGESGRLSDIQVDQARQQELSAKNGVIAAEQRLAQLLDEFKLFLGLPIEFDLAIRRDELDSLIETGVIDLEIDEDLATGLALEERLDHLNVLGELVDAERRIGVRADALRAGLALDLSFAAASEGGRPLVFDEDDVSWSVGLGLDLPFDRLRERNDYRRAEIAVQVRRRAADQSADTIRADLRDSLRRLRAARETYEIQQNSVMLAERRIESTTLNLEAGRAQTRDLLEAQEDLLAAQNARTRALIDYTLASLSLYLDMEMLRLDEEGLGVDEGLESRLQEVAS